MEVLTHVKTPHPPTAIRHPAAEAVVKVHVCVCVCACDLHVTFKVKVKASPPPAMFATLAPHSDAHLYL